MSVIKKIVITGGPCAGKTSCKSAILESVLKAGYIPIFIGETATEVKLSGIDPCSGILTPFKFQTLLSKLQVAKEDNYLKVLEKAEDKFVVFYDRALLDNKAYMSQKMWETVLDELKMTDLDVFERYDVVLHLVSAAEGAERFYTTANNEARKETLEEAKVQEKKNKEAYYGFPHIYYFSNEYSFEEKLNKVVGSVLSSIGKAEPILGVQKKYVVNKISEEELKKLNAQKAEIVQTYLYSRTSNVERRVRKITYYGSTAYYYTQKDNNRCIVKEVPISEKEYEILLEQRYNNYDIHKTRWYFNFNNLYFQYDEFSMYGDFEKYGILEAQTTNLQEKVKFLPECFKEYYDVTDCKIFTNFVISTNPDMKRYLVEYAKQFKKIEDEIN